MPKLLFFGELPPKTIHGISISNSVNLKFLSSKYEISLVEEFSDLKYHSKPTLAKYTTFFISYFKFLYKIIANNYDVYYGVLYQSTFGILKNILLVFTFKIFNPKAKVYLHIHRSDFLQYYSFKINQILFKIAELFTYHFIVLSKSQVEILNSMSIFNTSQLNNCIELEVSPEFKNYKKEEPFKLLFLSNFILEKGTLDLINACKYFNRISKKKVLLHLIGNYSRDITKEVLSELISNEPFIIIHEDIHGVNKFEMIKNSDALILPSYNEGLPLVLLEAMSQAKPIIISCVGYIEEALGNNYLYYCEPGNINSIVNCIERLRDNYSIGLQKEIFKKYDKYSLAKHKLELLHIFS